MFKIIVIGMILISVIISSLGVLYILYEENNKLIDDDCNHIDIEEISSEEKRD